MIHAPMVCFVQFFLLPLNQMLKLFVFTDQIGKLVFYGAEVDSSVTADQTGSCPRICHLDSLSEQ
jgi:hypothetical protein